MLGLNCWHYLQMPIYVRDNEVLVPFLCFATSMKVYNYARKWLTTTKSRWQHPLYWQDVLMSHCQELVFCSDLGIYLQVVFNQVTTHVTWQKMYRHECCNDFYQQDLLKFLFLQLMIGQQGVNPAHLSAQDLVCFWLRCNILTNDDPRSLKDKTFEKKLPDFSRQEMHLLLGLIALILISN